MHFFAVLLFLGLATMGLTMLGERGYRRLREGRAFMALAWGTALAWLADFNMWSGWSISNLRYAWVGVTLTGLALGGTALISHAVVGFFAGLYRKFDDEAEKIEEKSLRKVA